MTKISWFLLLVVIVLTILFFYFRSTFLKTDEVSKSFSQFVEIQGEDKYVLAKLVSHEKFASENFSTVMGYPVGETTVELSLVANYNYYVKFAEITHHIEDGKVVITIPKLYLLTPVAFEFSTVKEEIRTFLFGTNGKEILDKLKREASDKLIIKGQSQMAVIYDKAAKALADNFNNHFIKNGFGVYYKSIVVKFSSEKSQSERQFNYNASFCGKKPCLLEFDLGKGNIFRIE